MRLEPRAAVKFKREGQAKVQINGAVQLLF